MRYVLFFLILLASITLSAQDGTYDFGLLFNLESQEIEHIIGSVSVKDNKLVFSYSAEENGKAVGKEYVITERSLITDWRPEILGGLPAEVKGFITSNGDNFSICVFSKKVETLSGGYVYDVRILWGKKAYQLVQP